MDYEVVLKLADREVRLEPVRSELVMVQVGEFLRAAVAQGALPSSLEYGAPDGPKVKVYPCLAVVQNVPSGTSLKLERLTDAIELVGDRLPHRIVWVPAGVPDSLCSDGAENLGKEPT